MRWVAALGLVCALAGLGPVPQPVPRPVAGAGPSLATPPDRGVAVDVAAPAEVGGTIAGAVVAPVAVGVTAPVAVAAAPAGAGPGEALRRAAAFSGVSGWFAVDLDTGAVMDQGGADTAFAPASVAKLPTAVFALDRLGPAHRFGTRLAVTGPVRGGVVQGDLVLVGGGDPELDGDDLVRLMDAARGAGVTGVAGRLLVDAGRGVRVAAIEPSQPSHVGYNPGVSGLNLNFNRVRLAWDGNRRAPRLSLTAQAERTETQVGVISVMPDPDPDAPTFAFAMDGAGERWRMATRAMRGMGSTALPVKAPDLYAGDVLRQIADARGLALPRPERGEAPPGAAGLARLDSRPLIDMLRDMLKHSTNLTAEAVGVAAASQDDPVVAEAAPRAGLGALIGQMLAPQAAAAVRPGPPGSLAESAAAMNAWAARLLGLVPGDPGFQLVNHSGLSTASRLSPRRMVQFLEAVARRPVAAEAAHPRLPGPIAGLLKGYNAAADDGALDYARLDIAAKTGTMDYVRGLAGYIATPGGRRLAFAIFSNDLARRPPVPGSIDKAWMGRARGFERALIRAWVHRADGTTG